MRRSGLRVVSFLLLALLLCHTAGASNSGARRGSTADFANDPLISQNDGARRILQNSKVAGSADELNLRVSLALLRPPTNHLIS